jgi:hypothetical protein
MSITKLVSRIILAACVLCGRVLPAAAQGTPSMLHNWSGLPLGPYRVGYRILYLSDPSRTVLPDTITRTDRQTQRTLGVRMWYPTSARGSTVTFSEVVDTARRTPWIAHPLAERTMSLEHYAARKYASAGSPHWVAADTADMVRLALNTPTSSIANAAPLAGRHPLVVFAGGTYHSTDENVGLWEYLASRGYVIAVIPTTATEFEPTAAYLPDDALGLETLTRDLEFITSVMVRRSEVDSTRIVASGFSFGGAAALYAAARNERYIAVVGLDPSFIAAKHRTTIQNAPLFDPRRVHASVLEFHRADTTVDLTIERSAVNSDRTSYELRGLDHVDFNSYVLLYGDQLRARRPLATRDTAIQVKAAAYRAMVGIIGRFLDAAVGVHRTPEQSSVWTGVPDGFVLRTVFPANKQ